MLALTYFVGSATIAAGEVTVTGDGTHWLRSVRKGDYFGSHVGLNIRIAEVVSDDELTLAFEWPGESQTEEPYEIAFASEASRATAQTREVIDRLRALDINTQGLFYNFSTATTDADHGVGVLAFNNATLSSVVNIYASTTDANDTGRSVAGLLGLPDIGTTLIIRSVESTAYVAYTLSAPATTATGYRKFLNVDYVEHDGSFVDGEALSVSWLGIGEGLAVDAVGTFAGRTAYNAGATGFIYLSTNGNGTSELRASLYRKNTGTSGDWSAGAVIGGPAGDDGTDGTDGEDGWTETHAIVTDGARSVLKVIAYIGGSGSPPTTNLNKYLGAAGYQSNIANAVDIRGAVGEPGTPGAQGDDGEPGGDGPAGWSPAFAIVTDDDRRVLQLVAWVGGGGSTPTANIGDYLASGGFTSNIASADDIRGPSGVDGPAGADGTDPGVLLWFEVATADADQGAGKVWGDDVDLTLVETLYVSKWGRTGDPIDTFLAQLTSSSSPTRKGIIFLSRSGGNAFISYDLISLTDATDYVKLTVANPSGVDAFDDGDTVSFQFYPAGDAGLAGDGAFNGPDGAVSGNVMVFGDVSGQLGEDSGVAISDLVQAALNGADFASPHATLDNLHVLGGDVASGATVNLDTATGGILDVTGTVTTTAITLTSGRERWVRAAAAWPITVGGSLELNNGGSSYTCAAGDLIHFYADGSVIRGTIFPLSGQQVGVLGISKGGHGQTTAAAGFDALTVKGSNIPSALTTDIGAATGVLVHVTGITTIAGFGTKAAGVIRVVVFDGILTLAHNGTSLILPNGVDIVTEVGDVGVFVSEGSGNWTCVSFTQGGGSSDWGDITGTPTTLAGYGITDAAPKNNPTFTGTVTLAADPTVALEAATKQYVDNLAAGLDIKPSVRAATIGNITLSGAQTIDGVSVIAADRVLVKSQSTASQNGIYVAAAGAWARAADMDSWLEVPGATVWVEEGTTLADTAWVSTANAGGTLNTTSITWTQFGGTGAFQQANANLTAIAALAVTAGNIMVGNGSTWVAESGATARASLGLTIGTHVQAWDADLDAIASAGSQAYGRGLLAYSSEALFKAGVNLEIGVDVQAYDADLAAIAALATQAYGRGLLAHASEAAFKAGVNLEIGTDVQAYNAGLAAIAAAAVTDGNILVGNGTTWVVESGATARASLGLTIGTHVAAYDAQLAAIAALAVTDGGFIVGNGSTFVLETTTTVRTSLGLGTGDTPTFAALTLGGGALNTGGGAISTTSGNINSGTGRIRSQGTYDATTANASNMYIGDTGVSYAIYRSTSSIDYKTDVEDLDDALIERVLDLRPAWFRSTSSGDRGDWSYIGFVAEEVAEIEPRLAFFQTHEQVYAGEEAVVVGYKDVVVGSEEVVVGRHPKTGRRIYKSRDVVERQPVIEMHPKYETREREKPKPDGVQYDRVGVLLQGLAKKQRAQINSLETRLADMEVRLARLEGSAA